MIDLINITLKQFNPFEKEGGLLPSFLVQKEPLVDNFKKSLVQKSKLGDYTFYSFNNINHVISLDSFYLCFHRGFSSATIYDYNHNKENWNHDLIYLLMQGYMYRLVESGNLMIHSAAVIYQNNGILFCGMSGAGKSTQANLWEKFLKAEILNYDKPCIIKNKCQYYVHGSPWSGKEGVYKNKYANLQTIVFVNQSRENRVERIPPTKAYANLFLHNYVYPITTEIEEKYGLIIQQIAEHIPVYNLFCDISENAVQVLFNELFPELDYYRAKEESVMTYKIKDSFVMKKVADEFIVTQRGAEAVDFSAVVVFNETGAFLWKKMKDYISIDELATALAEKYDLAIDTAKTDCVAFVEKLQNNSFLEQQ